MHGAGWVVEQLGVTPATLRSWHHHHGLDPAGRTRGGHRRYSAGDVGRLRSMCRLIASGVPVGESARLSHLVPPGEPRVLEPRVAPTGPSPVAARHVELLTRSATALDQVATSRIVVEVLHDHGVVSAWTDVLAPALRLRGEQFARTGNGINAEHLLSECVRAALSGFAWRRRRWHRLPLVLLASPDGEHHVLALHALAAALAEVGRPSVLLGMSVPARGLVDAVTQLDPAATFLWSQSIDTAHRPDFSKVSSASGHRDPVVVLGGPGWPAGVTGWVEDLPQALHACTRPTLPSLDRPPAPSRPPMAS